MNNYEPYTRVLTTIETIRNSFEGADVVYSKGSCLQFALILLDIYPKGRILYDDNHAIFEYDGRYYDINGLTSKNMYHKHLEEYSMAELSQMFYLKYKIKK